MPKFFYSIFALLAVLWGAFAYLLINTAPESLWNIVLFLGTFFVALGFTLSIPLYFYFHKKAPTFTNLRGIYRKSLKWGFFCGFGIVGTLGLRAFDLINLLNYGLFIVLYVVVFVHLKNER